MSTKLQLRRGSTNEANVTVGTNGELFVDLDNKRLRLLDGTTEGGTEFLNTSDVLGLMNNTQQVLISGQNIKTLNGSSLLGSGDLEFTFEPDLVSGQDIKTINGESIVGAGDLEIGGAGSGYGGVHVKDFGAVGDGVTDDTAAIQAALDSISDGGTLLISDGTFLVSSADINFPQNVTLKGSYEHSGSRGSNAQFDYNSIDHIILDGAYSINLNAGCVISGCLITRFGMSFPETTLSSTWNGTAVVMSADDGMVENSMIIGFETAIYSDNVQRTKVKDCNIDCHNGIEISQCWDIARINNVHCWPFASVANGWPQNGATQYRNIAFNFHDGGDWCKATDCFSWGYQRGFYINACNSITLMGCGADNHWDNQQDPDGPLHADSIGIYIHESAEDTKIISCQTAANDHAGIVIDVLPTQMTQIIGHTQWGGSEHGVLIYGGHTIVSNSVIRETSNGITVDDTASQVILTNNLFRDVGVPFNFTAYDGAKISSNHFINCTSDKLDGGSNSTVEDQNNYYTILSGVHSWLTDGSQKMRLDDGDLTVTGDITAFSSALASDMNLKENIVNVSDALSKVNQLNGVEFTWKESGEKAAGVIAQDVEKVLPQAVKEAHWAGDSHKTVRYDALHALLIESIKELTARIEKLES